MEEIIKNMVISVKNMVKNVSFMEKIKNGFKSLSKILEY